MSEEDLALEALTEFFNAVEAGIAAARQRIKAIKVEWDPGSIKWENAEGASGPYERSEDVNNPQFKGMLKDLAAHGGKMTNQGLFYWVFPNGSTVGRKKRGKGKVKPAAGLEKITGLFSEDLRSLLSFEETADSWILKPRQFLGSDNFSRIAAIVRGADGEYISAGRDSHFKVPRKPGE